MIALAVVLSVALASGAAVAIVYRRQRSEDARSSREFSGYEHLDSLQRNFAEHLTKHRELREEFDRVKLLVPRPQGR